MLDIAYILEVAGLLPPKIFDVLVALPNGFGPKLFDCETCVAPPKIDAVLVLLATDAVPPNIFCAGLFAAADAKILPVVAPVLGVDDTGGGDDIPKLPNALSTVLELKILAPLACCGLDVSCVFTPNKLLAGLEVGGVLAAVVIALPPKMLVCADVVGVCAAPPNIELGLVGVALLNEFDENKFLPAENRKQYLNILFFSH